jgi:hypothetical protein
LWRGCRSCDWFVYRPDIVVTKGAAGHAQPANCERCRQKSHEGKSKFSTDHEPNNWRERTLVARSTLCEAAPPVERHSARMNGSAAAWPWSAGFSQPRIGANLRHTEVFVQKELQDSARGFTSGVEVFWDVHSQDASKSSSCSRSGVGLANIGVLRQVRIAPATARLWPLSGSTRFEQLPQG